jgi:hypothetical protein
MLYLCKTSETPYYKNVMKIYILDMTYKKTASDTAFIIQTGFVPRHSTCHENSAHAALQASIMWGRGPLPRRWWEQWQEETGH